jgi:hypothetical protein
MNNRYFEDVCFLGYNNDYALKATQPLEEYVASTFRLEEEADQDTSVESGCDKLLRNVG